jgi:predicted membrane metal-binding protein
MRRINRDRLVIRGTLLALALAVVAYVCLIAVGGVSGIISALAIALAVLSDAEGKRTCSLPFVHRRE